MEKILKMPHTLSISEGRSPQIGFRCQYKLGLLKPPECMNRREKNISTYAKTGVLKAMCPESSSNSSHACAFSLMSKKRKLPFYVFMTSIRSPIPSTKAEKKEKNHRKSNVGKNKTT